jgi:hypothetical protein
MSRPEYFKAVRLDGGSFHAPMFKWALAPGGVTEHPSFDRQGGEASGYLSVSTSASDCTGFQWPCRLLVVQSHGCRVWTPSKSMPNKRAGRAFVTVREADPSWVFGPNCPQVVDLLARASTLTRADVGKLDAARAAARAAARDAARDAAWAAAWAAAGAAARAAAWAAAGAAARDAARAAAGLVTRDLITTEHYDTLTLPWRSSIGPIHPDDPAVIA